MSEYDDGDRAMDERLRFHAEAWRETVDADVTDLEPLPNRRPAWLAPLAVAATVAAIVGATFAVRGDGETRTPSNQPTSSASPNGDIVPWRDLPASNPKLPITRTPPSPTMAQIAATRACAASDLQLVRSGSPDGLASGSQYMSVEMRAKAEPCRLNAGYPRISALRGGSVLDVPIINEHATDLPVKAVVVTKTRPAQVTVVFTLDQCPAREFDELLVRIPQIDRQTRIPGPFRSYCSPGEGTDPLRVWPIRSESPPSWVVDSPFDHLRASGNLDLKVAAGSPARFVITLTSPVDLPLDPCPDYLVITTLAREQFALNCNAVPFRDLRGRPYLPAGQPVRFAMKAQTGDQDTDKFIWELVTPLERKNVVGSITIVRP
jgi:hypothetical protein